MVRNKLVLCKANNNITVYNRDDIVTITKTKSGSSLDCPETRTWRSDLHRMPNVN
jgi:hypothetical protein